MGITGVIGGTADAAAIKATKLAISGSVPVIGNILSDASETILVSASVVKSAAGVYGVLAIAAIWIGPFLEVGIQYLLLKLTAGICGLFGAKRIVTLVQEFSTAMGFVVAMICTISVLLLIGVVCYMKGAST
jgi:stage III sporulation protein AE